jgi:hypothetical protein
MVTCTIPATFVGDLDSVEYDIVMILAEGLFERLDAHHVIITAYSVRRRSRSYLVLISRDPCNDDVFPTV